MHKFYLRILTLSAIMLIFGNNLFAQSYKLVWSDEFNGTSLDQSKWNYETGNNNGNNNEWEYYTTRSQNLYFDNGMMVIKAIKEDYGGQHYTSARINTSGKFSFKYGKIEARMKLPYGQGIWPAFWMLGDNISSVGWPASGETDIMELIGGSASGRDNTVYGTVHWSQNGSHAQYGKSYTLSSGIFADDFHTFAITWDPQQIVWYVDGKSYCAIDISSADLSAFQNKSFIIFNLAVGGDWPGYPDNTTVFPQTMQVDYVRVYEDTDIAPQISITSPSSNTDYPENSNISIKADASVGNGNISLVEFYQGSMKIGETDLAPYAMTWRNVLSGNYTISAKVYTDKNFTSVSDAVNVKVGSGSVNAPFGGSAFNIPGIIEAENYNLGGSNVGYYDSTPGNTGGTYRSDDVDIQECSDTNGGYDIGWVTANEWLAYSVDVKKTAEYQFTTRVASNSTGGKFHIEIDGTNVTGSLTAPVTGGWQTWKDVVSSNINLQAGFHIMKLVIESGEFNINKIDVYEPNTQPQIQVVFPNGNEDLQIGSIQEIRWNSLMVSDVKIGLSTDGGKSWSTISSGSSSQFGVLRWEVPSLPSKDCKIMILNKDNLSIGDQSDSTFSIQEATSVKDKIQPQGFLLEQNYPNPFNPTTSIKYQIPSNAFVTIKVYDYLGKEISTLVNQNKSAGVYITNFSGNNLASGIYFYTLSLKSNDLNKSYHIVKKMTLLK